MKIIGSGSALPDQVVTNDDLCKILDTSDEWIVTHTGISSRRILKDETVYELGALAAKRALEEANAASLCDLIDTAMAEQMFEAENIRSLRELAAENEELARHLLTEE